MRPSSDDEAELRETGEPQCIVEPVKASLGECIPESKSWAPRNHAEWVLEKVSFSVYWRRSPWRVII